MNLDVGTLVYLELSEMFVIICGSKWIHYNKAKPNHLLKKNSREVYIIWSDDGYGEYDKLLLNRDIDIGLAYIVESKE